MSYWRRLKPILYLKGVRIYATSYKTSCDIHATLKDIKIPQAVILLQDILKNAHTEEQLTRTFEIVQTLALI